MTTIIKNQTINVRKTVIGWMAKDPESANAVIFGTAKQERHTAHRLNNILEAHQTNTDLPAISYQPQFGTLIDGRHRLAVAYLLGIENIQADLYYC